MESYQRQISNPIKPDFDRNKIYNYLISMLIVSVGIVNKKNTLYRIWQNRMNRFKRFEFWLDFGRAYTVYQL